MTWRDWNWVLIRNLGAFWLLGLCNNYGYVIMLSAAQDIMDQEAGKATIVHNETCLVNVTTRGCSSASTGAVLLADNLPALLVQATFPFFMHRIPFGVRHAFVCVLQIGSYFMVAFSQNRVMSLAGVTLASFGQGIGEITYLAMSSFFPPSTIAAWSSGTGGAGLIGSFAYAFLTEPNMGNLSPSNALLCMLFIPVLFAVAYWMVLVVPDSVYSPSFDPRTWAIPADHDADFKIKRDLELEEMDDETREKESNTEKVPQRKLSVKEKLWHVVPLLHLMIPLGLVYMAEYLINQGLTEMIFFNCKQGWHLTKSSQYRWYQVLYQLGVFLSRSSVRIIELPTWAIYLLPILQTVNMTFFLFEAIYWFVPNIGIVFALIVLEGLLGGSAYVNTYNKIHKMVSPDVREYSLSVTSLGNSVGTNMAGFLAIPLHNWVCNKPIH